MPENRFFVSIPLYQGQLVTLAKEEMGHFHVMRLETSDEVTIVNGNHQLGLGSVCEIHKDHAMISIESVITKKPGPSLHLYQGLCRPAIMDFILEKATELGVTDFHLFLSENSELKSFSREERMQKILIAALKQCGRLDLPKIHLEKSLLSLPLPQDKSFFGDLRENTPWLLNQSATKNESLSVFIGPEKGFSLSELNHLEKKIGAIGVRLHENTLRAETAAMISVSALYFLQNK